MRDTGTDLKGIIFEIKRFAVHDGPGIRTTVFFKGCPLSCLWCHNPEGISGKTEIAYLKQSCTGCFLCQKSCERKLRRADMVINNLIKDECIYCEKCVNACLNGALKLYGKDYSINELLEIVLEDREFYSNSGGGITCSGGEPLSQAEFLISFLCECKKAGLHTAVDTSGFSSWENMEEAAKYTDLFLYDLKVMDNQKHLEYCSVRNKEILENIIKLGEAGSKIEVRIPVIPGFNDDEENLKALTSFLKKIDNLVLVTPLPYHSLSGTKYESIGMELKMPFENGTERERVNHFIDHLKNEGLPLDFFDYP